MKDQSIITAVNNCDPHTNEKLLSLDQDRDIYSFNVYHQVYYKLYFCDLFKYKMFCIYNKRTDTCKFYEIIDNTIFELKLYDQYEYIRLQKPNMLSQPATRNIMLFLHRCIASIFLSDSFNKQDYIIDHIDRNPHNNKLSNLRIVNSKISNNNREFKNPYNRLCKRDRYRCIFVNNFDKEFDTLKDLYFHLCNINWFDTHNPRSQGHAPSLSSFSHNFYSILRHDYKKIYGLNIDFARLK